MAEKILATCKCGAVNFVSKSQPILQLACHCADCRNASGNDFSEIVFFNQADCLVTGGLKSTKFTSFNGNVTQRQFCEKCEEVMFDLSSGFKTMQGVMAERLQPPFAAEPKIHVWLDSKLAHVQIPPNIKTFQKGMS